MPGLPVKMVYLKMVDSKNGWARGNLQKSSLYGDHILRTEDGGSTWQDVTPAGFTSTGSYSNAFGMGMDVLDKNTAWVISTFDFLHGKNGLAGTVWRTDNGGRSWKPGNPIILASPGNIFAAGEGYRTLQFVDAKHGWLAAQVKCAMGLTCRYVYKTSDGGANWEGLPFYCEDACPFPTFTDATTGWKKYSVPWTRITIVSKLGALETSGFWNIQKSNDEGRTWKDVPLPAPADLVNLLKDSQYAQDKIGFDDTFQQIGKGVVGLRMEYTLLSSAGAQLLDKSYYYISGNAGRSWSSFPVSGQVFFLDRLTGWQLSGQNDKYLLEKTSDGGTTWQKMAEGLTWHGIIQFTDAQEGWAVVTEPFLGQLLHTTDGGQSWTDLQPRRLPPETARPIITATQVPKGAPVNIPPEDSIARMDPGTRVLPQSLHMLDASNGWAVGQYGYLFHTSDDGSTWQDVTPLYGAITGQRGFFALDAKRAWTTVVPPPGCLEDFPPDPCPAYYRSFGPVWFTTDAGQSWHPTAIFPGNLHLLNSDSLELRFLNESTGWAQWEQLDATGKTLEHHMMLTTDGGATWQVQKTQPGHGTIAFTSAQIGFGTEFVLDTGTTTIQHNSLQDYLDGKVVPVIGKTTDGGLTWEPLHLPKILPMPADVQVDERMLKIIMPKGLDDWNNSPASCYWDSLKPISATGIGLELSCNAPPFDFSEYYLSLDSGQSWNVWFSSWFLDDSTGKIGGWIQGGGESFLPDGTGWRLFAPGGKQLNQMQKTLDGGKSWTSIQKVAWPYAQFDFVNAQVGWAIITGYTTALVQTKDGGITWSEVKPVVMP